MTKLKIVTEFTVYSVCNISAATSASKSTIARIIKRKKQVSSLQRKGKCWKKSKTFALEKRTLLCKPSEFKIRLLSIEVKEKVGVNVRTHG